MKRKKIVSRDYHCTILIGAETQQVIGHEGVNYKSIGAPKKHLNNETSLVNIPCY